MNSLTPHQIKALNYKKHISLTANAGSGKTFVLSKRYLEIVLNENIHLRNIAAITFTDKAAGELYKKITEELNERIKRETVPEAAAKLENIRRQLVSAGISTIHSFCIDILKEYPVEAGLDANFTPIDVNLSNELIELSVDEMIRNTFEKMPDAAGDNHADEQYKLKYLIRIFGSKQRFEDELITLIQNRKNVLSIAAGIYAGSPAAVAEFFYKRFRSSLFEILFVKIEEFCANLLRINKAAEDSRGSRTDRIAEIISLILNSPVKDGNDESILSAVSLLEEIKRIVFTGNDTVRLNYLPRISQAPIKSEIEFVKNHLEVLNCIQIPGNEKEIELELAKFGKNLILFFNKTVEIYSRKKSENGYLDYEDILLHTFEILQKKEIREELSEKYKYIMIDEYQDTNEIQYRIFLPLLSFLKKNNLFVVGDEKQSIYMFRDAELEVFEKTRKDIELNSGKEALLTLPDSFRMAPSICLFINSLFKNLFSNPNIIFNEVEHKDLVCARDNSNLGGVEILLSEKSKDEEDKEAELVSKRILMLVSEKKINFSSIAVLCRKRKFFEPLEKAFVKHAVPYSIVGGKGFYQRQSVYDIFNYFSFLLDKENDTALVGILRSPFFSVSDSIIYEISLCVGYNFWKKLKNFAETRKEYLKITEVLEKNLKLANRLELTSLLRIILTESGYLAVLAAKPNGIQETANIEKLIKLTTAFNEQGFRTLYDYVEFLEESINELEDEAQAPLPEEINLSPGEGSVKVMTLHQAKGLEFPVVFLIKCEETAAKDKVKPKSVTVSKDFGLLTKVPLGENYFGEYLAAPLAGISNLITDKKNFAEIKRLFYVGATRAKDYLFLSGSSEEGKKFNRESFFGLLCDGLGIDLSSNYYELNSDLTFLEKENGVFKNVKREMRTGIAVIRNVVKAEAEAKAKAEAEAKAKMGSEKKVVHVSSINDFPKGEIFSATKISLYKQCPLKYKFTYDLRYSGIYNKYKEWKTLELFSKNKEFEFQEDEEKQAQNDFAAGAKSPGTAEIKGRIIHSILQKDIPPEQLKTFINDELEAEKDFSELQDLENLKDEIYSSAKLFLGSDTYASIKSNKNFKNEFEVHTAENDYFLYGIIDKIIF
ncbi:MAG TPA: UvrD-helicase domain-containing protein, partial [Ignavibacteriaceae bacterium]|nr:UvrD-helicase domain-containing protein [Ignavibacteriaceae bacterium]